VDTEQRYEVIEDSHGEGGFGKISKQRDKFLERFVAVKRLHMLSDREAKARFVREAKTLARMSHTNIPAIYDVKFNENEMLIYFEFVEGSNLRRIITDGRIPSMECARRWFMQVGSALEHAHSLGIVHRDVKPENIIISSDENSAVLVDFGIALTADDVKRITDSGYVIGTRGYMSPEQMAGEELDGRSDLYSLALTLYETLCGHLPQAGEYHSLSENNEAIPPSIDTLIRACLTQEKNRRIESASLFVAQLKNALRTDVPLSALLTEARLHEIVGALRQMSSEDFNSKPRGQKLLIINRLKDLMRTDQKQLRQGTAELIALLTRLTILEPPAEYSTVVNAAFEWGFNKSYAEKWQGNQEVRESLIDSSKEANDKAHTVLSAGFLSLLEPLKLEDLQGWYTHDLRIIAMSLLANPKCGESVADKLAVAYDRINEQTH
jgi:serine/threonine protein kinase